jgi:hypothetical protein
MLANEAMIPQITVTNRAPTPATLKESSTSNGIRVISYDNGAPAVNLTFGIVGGSRAESVSESGFSHLLACNAFNGSSNVSPLKMIRALDNNGAVISSNANRESVTYTVQCTDDHVNDVVTTVADYLCNSFNSDKFYYFGENLNAAKVGLNAYNADGSAQLEDLLHEAAYGENSPLGKPVLNSACLNAATCDIMSYRGNTFAANNLVVTGTGISHDNLRALVDANFSSMKSGAKIIAAPSPFVGGETKVRADLSGVTHAGIAFSVSSGAASAFAVLANKFSAGIDGVPKNAMSVFHNQFTDSGIFGFKFHGTAQETAAYIEAACNALKNISIAAGDVKSAALVSNSSLISATLTGVSSESIAKVSTSDVVAAAKAACNSTPAYAVYGTTFGAASYANVQKMLK